MKINRWALAGVLVVVALGVVWFVRGRSKQAAPKYRTATIERGDITASVSATGTVRPVIQVEVGSQVSGTLDKLYVDFNSRVRAGQVLCTLEPSAFRARLAQAEASVAKAAAALKDGNRQLTRSQELASKDFISQADVEAAEVAVEQRRADLKQAQAQLQSAQVDLNHATIRAPIDGVVISRSIDVGQTVAASLQAPTLFVIANDLTRMQVETRIDEADIGRIQPGLPVSFNVDAFPDQNFEGKVSQVRLEPITDQNVVTYTTVIETKNDQLRLRPGMTANVVVQVESKQGVLKVPNAALRFRPVGGTGGRAGQGGGAPPGMGGMRRTIVSLLDKLAPAAYAQSPPSGERRTGRRTGSKGAGDARPAAPDSAAQGGSGWSKGLSGGRSFSGKPNGGGPPGYKPGQVYLLRNGKPTAMPLMTGITDGSMTEVMSKDLQEGDVVVIGVETPTSGPTNLQPPPGMGGPQMRGPGRR